MGDHNVCPSCGGYSLEPALKDCKSPEWTHPPLPKVTVTLTMAPGSEASIRGMVTRMRRLADAKEIAIKIEGLEVT